MKFILFSLVLCVTLLSCNPNNPTPNPPTANSVQTSWTMTVDNKTYSWSDTYHEVDGDWYPEHFETNPGGCMWSYYAMITGGSSINLGTTNLPGFTEDGLFCALDFYPMNTGSWDISGNSWLSGVSNPSGFYLEINDYPSVNTWGTSSTTWNMVPGNNNVVLNITEFSTSKGGLVKGNFNGTFSDINNVAHTVSGNFSAIRTE